MGVCNGQHDQGFDHLDVEIQDLKFAWDFGYRYSFVESLGPTPPSEKWLELKISFSHYPKTLLAVSFALAQDEWENPQGPSEKDKQTLMDRSLPELRAFVRMFEEEGTISLTERPIFV